MRSVSGYGLGRILSVSARPAMMCRAWRAHCGPGGCKYSELGGLLTENTRQPKREREPIRFRGRQRTYLREGSPWGPNCAAGRQNVSEESFYQASARSSCERRWRRLTLSYHIGVLVHHTVPVLLYSLERPILIRQKCGSPSSVTVTPMASVRGLALRGTLCLGRTCPGGAAHARPPRYSGCPRG